MDCRDGCGACCIAISISSKIPGMENGKPAGIACIHLTGNYRCAIFGESGRPAVCSGLKPSEEMCGKTREEALSYLTYLEKITQPE